MSSESQIPIAAKVASRRFARRLAAFYATLFGMTLLSHQIGGFFGAWLGGMAAHRALTGQMLLYKLELGHLHLQAGALLRVSRTVQWWREAARRRELVWLPQRW